MEQRAQQFGRRFRVFSGTHWNKGQHRSARKSAWRPLVVRCRPNIGPSPISSQTRFSSFRGTQIVGRAHDARPTNEHAQPNKPVDRRKVNTTPLHLGEKELRCNQTYANARRRC